MSERAKNGFFILKLLELNKEFYFGRTNLLKQTYKAQKIRKYFMNSNHYCLLTLPLPNRWSAQRQVLEFRLNNNNKLTALPFPLSLLSLNWWNCSNKGEGSGEGYYLYLIIDPLI